MFKTSSDSSLEVLSGFASPCTKEMLPVRRNPVSTWRRGTASQGRPGNLACFHVGFVSGASPAGCLSLGSRPWDSPGAWEAYE